ncbi:hypothetical protein BKH43_06195 [Helicobacter sp. 13S00401-1]|uniref:hypothetical protein n=1 Tax=Helicobacter sp. 13S00401-1 TaxID=1905758 RepID=UPI000BA7C310|nr:hypothetical protein [Helicobacter sp. 13S00401-1]PAF50081.1 hypothetical protein BKH43_06195 [Helicobacter sp. 13S00401-1]
MARKVKKDSFSKLVAIAIFTPSLLFSASESRDLKPLDFEALFQSSSSKDFYAEKLNKTNLQATTQPTSPNLQDLKDESKNLTLNKTAFRLPLIQSIVDKKVKIEGRWYGIDSNLVSKTHPYKIDSINKNSIVISYIDPLTNKPLTSSISIYTQRKDFE